jgi:hypothetical protein
VENSNINTDMGKACLGGVLSQVQDTQESAVAYYSKNLSKARSNYCVTQQELLLTVKMLEHLHKYFYRQEFHLHSIHFALTWPLSFNSL